MIEELAFIGAITCIDNNYQVDFEKRVKGVAHVQFDAQLIVVLLRISEISFSFETLLLYPYEIIMRYQIGSVLGFTPQIGSGRIGSVQFNKMLCIGSDQLGFTFFKIENQR